jgi:excisionase family DNA binding protein
VTTPRRPVVVVIGAPDETVVTSLRIVGLVPVAVDGDVVVWGAPMSRRPAMVAPPLEQPAVPAQVGLLMTIGDAALALGLGRSTVYELIGRGELEVVHIGRSARVPREALRRFVARYLAHEGSAAPVDVSS